MTKTLKRTIREHSEKTNPHRIYRAHLAEDYDGIGQWVLVFLSNGSTSTAYKARVSSGDFATGQVIPEKTPVSVFVYHGQVEILSLGFKL
jgi:hypothetical protein